MIKKSGGLISPYEKFSGNLFQTFQVDLEKLIEMKFVICKQLNQSWNEFDRLPFWEMEAMVEHLKKWVEREREEREKEEGKNKTMFDKDKFMRDTQSNNRNSMPKVPSSSGGQSWNKIGNFKPPAGINASSLAKFK